jgi:radical SAM superfamily enzyme YgiQ (UPF0313 family)
VGFSLRNIDSLDHTRVSSFVKEAERAVAVLRAETDAPLILGGAGFTLFPQRLMAILGAEYGVVGEGERARALVDALEAGADPRGLPGVVSKGGPAPRPVPLAAGARVLRASPTRNPSLGYYLARGGVLGLRTQRGCRLRCVYCTYPHIEGRRPVLSDPLSVVEEARRLEEAGARYLVLTDAVMNGIPEHALAVGEAFRKGGLKLPWGGFFTPTAPAPGFYEALRAAGCTHVEFGTESLSDAVLPGLCKPFRRRDVMLAHAAARGAGLHVAHFMALGGPGETRDTVEETLDGCEALEGAPVFFFCGLRIYPHTELFLLAVASGQVEIDQDLLAPVFYRPPKVELLAISEAVRSRAAGRRGFVTGAGGEWEGVLARLHARGRVGPLWEHLCSA